MRSIKTFDQIIIVLALLIGAPAGIGAAALEPRVILFLGDSLTAGYGVDPSQAYPALIQQKIDSKGWNFRVVNAGQSGDTSAGGLSRLGWLLRSAVDVLVLELGGNDGLRGIPAEVTRKNLQSIIDRTREKYPRVRVVVAGMQVPPNMGREYGERFRSIFPELARRNRAALIPFLLDRVGGAAELNLPDGVHPTARGHELVADNVWKVLEPMLRSLLRDGRRKAER
jgi:acyl-CoA thioesterase I